MHLLHLQRIVTTQDIHIKMTISCHQNSGNNEFTQFAFECLSTQEDIFDVNYKIINLMIILFTKSCT